MNILLTGGLGFIGSHTAVELIRAGHHVVIYDNLCNASKEVLSRIESITGVYPTFIEGDVRHYLTTHMVLRQHDIQVVVHFAALKAVGESVEQPLEYYENNVGGTITLLRAMRDAGVKRIVFSSSATVYGTPSELSITEDTPLGEVTNPYGRTKKQIEEILADVCRADSRFSAVNLRYFNPIGAHPSGLLGENPNGIPNNLFPYIARVAAGQLEKLFVLGDDYDTPDGTGVRDYIHVVDLTVGHVKAVRYAFTHSGWIAINLGCGRGYSVLEVVEAFKKASGKDVPYVIKPRRAGDIAASWCDPSRARQLLEWEAQYDLDQMCVDGWHFMQKSAEIEAAAAEAKTVTEQPRPQPYRPARRY